MNGRLSAHNTVSKRSLGDQPAPTLRAQCGGLPQHPPNAQRMQILLALVMACLMTFDSLVLKVLKDLRDLTATGREIQAYPACLFVIVSWYVDETPSAVMASVKLRDSTSWPFLSSLHSTLCCIVFALTLSC